MGHYNAIHKNGICWENSDNWMVEGLNQSKKYSFIMIGGGLMPRKKVGNDWISLLYCLENMEN